MTAWNKTPTQRIARHLRSRGWSVDEGSARHRIYELFSSRRRHWSDWAHPVMTLTGRWRCGNAEPPRGNDLWWIPAEYVEGPEASLVADFEQRNGCYITWSYRDVAATSDIPWRIFDLQDGGHTIVIGLWPHLPEHDGRIQPLPVWSALTDKHMRLLLWWYLVKHIGQGQWFGIRTWLYWRALHAAVGQRRPFTCKAAPAHGSGGYAHWNCHLRKRHNGPHRFNAYTWTGAGRVQHDQRQDVTR